MRWLLAVSLAFAVTACDKPAETKKDEAPAGEPVTKAPAKKAPAKKAAKKAELTLEKVSDAGWGYEIMIAKGSKVLQKGEYGHTYSFVLPGGMHELNVHLTQMKAETLEAAVRDATMMGGKAVQEKVALPDGFKVVKAPAMMKIQEIWVFKKGATANVTAKCSGPSTHFAKLAEICGSLKITK